MRRTLPPISALSCFEATVRLGSVTAAAEELNLTQSAVSKRVQALEAYLGRSLFVRRNRSLAPTAVALEYAGAIANVIETLDDATRNVVSGGAEREMLTVSSLPTFGSRWLVPRLGNFMQRHPNISINVISRMRPFQFQSEAAQLAIHFGKPNWPGAVCEYLMDERIIVVCSPSLLREPSGKVDWDELSSATLIQHSTRPQLWQEWLIEAGGPWEKAALGPRFEDYSHAIQAAVSGIGFAVLPDFLVSKEIDNRTLVQAHECRLVCDEKYYAVYPEKFRNFGSIRTFVDWLQEEIRTSMP